MAATQYISVREAAQLLGVSEKTVMDMIEARKLQAYRIADKFLRLKKSEVIQLRDTKTVVCEDETDPYTLQEKIRDFFYFNDFYIISLIIIGVLLYMIFFS